MMEAWGLGEMFGEQIKMSQTDRRLVFARLRVISAARMRENCFPTLAEHHRCVNLGMKIRSQTFLATSARAKSFP